jgi:predicted nucleic acid-binding protein
MQEEHESCKHIVELCEDGKVQLIVPAYSLVEPLETLIRHDNDRKKLADSIGSAFLQLGRSAPYKTETNAFQGVVSLLTRSGSEERERLSAIRKLLLEIAEIIPLDADILALASESERQHGLSPQDAIVYASVLHHLETFPSHKNCFLNRNSKDFEDPDLKDALANYNCKLLYKFTHGLAYIQNAVD